MASPQQINRHRLRVVTYVISGVWCLLFLLATIGNIEIRKNVMSELNKDLHRPDAIFIKEMASRRISEALAGVLVSAFLACSVYYNKRQWMLPWLVYNAWIILEIYTEVLLAAISSRDELIVQLVLIGAFSLSYTAVLFLYRMRDDGELPPYNIQLSQV